MSQSPQNPRRRWYQFGLGTLFFLFTAAIVATGWVVRQANTVRERDFAQQQLSVKGAVFPATIWPGTKTLRKPLSSSISGIRRRLGDRERRCIFFNHDPTDDELRLAEHFPEASLHKPAMLSQIDNLSDLWHAGLRGADLESDHRQH